MEGRPESERRRTTDIQDPTPRRGLQLVSGDGYSGWESVYRDNVGWVYGLMFSKVGNRADAEDLTAEVFMAALRPLRMSAGVAEVRAYLRATARTVLAGYWRTRMGREITTIVDDIADDPADEPTENAIAVTRARALLDRLPDRYRRILELRFLQGLSVRDSATDLGVSVANAKVLQHRALQMAAQFSEGGAR
ncbi:MULTISPECIES: RNA polymerase sigma factor [unclassified Rhodococcus (in: high G+C Gram-positive bacteria)]|uniref:RNA polymerase sigma factor n=1 Tax=unclassified Rhodococcus (in: high G+C Gram-positive bacteria) TaxID=192944 RepID=UPI001639E527|nr:MULTISPECIES: sigma-70 family RNA polymerase sigma factor [unclassified Rhodococcus (in: high G+C Gram-positive bacteria)]MBC2644213.1 sigma-70 family RNA polymerase sigma factor [Rhodococcus sp. 3A]MBC2891048.1 sigma-70 family RNA polymerase sigma factor [Rhodococcus sp. 4CII]